MTQRKRKKITRRGNYHLETPNITNWAGICHGRFNVGYTHIHTHNILSYWFHNREKSPVLEVVFLKMFSFTHQTLIKCYYLSGTKWNISYPEEFLEELQEVLGGC